MSRMIVTVIHQWWLNGPELEKLLFSGPAEVVETKRHPAHTDTTETRYDIPGAGLSCAVEDRLSAAGVELPVAPNSVVSFAGREIDERIVAVTVASV